MAINLSDLTGASTSADILAEVQSTADFLDSVPLLKNLADPSGATDAKQFTATSQPRALPLIKDANGKLGGYLYIPNASGNYATGPSVTIGSNETWEGELDMVVKEFGDHIFPMGGGVWTTGFGLIFYSDGKVRAFSKGVAGPSVASGVTLGTPFNAKYGYDGTNRYVKINDSVVWSDYAGDQSVSLTTGLQLNQQTLAPKGNFAIQKAKLTVNNAVVFDCDFNGSTSIRHGDTKFQAAVGGPVTINQSGQNPATVIKKSVLRFDGADDGLNGLFNQTITEGYMFAAFSVHGDGGESGARIFTGNSTGAFDYQTGGFAIRRYNATHQLQVRWNGGSEITHSDVFNGERGDFLLESPLRAGDQNSKINNADADDGACSLPNPVSSDEFNICTNSQGDVNAAIDLEYLALFPASITDEQADAVRNYINNRNNVFDLKDGFGYYFFDPQSLSSGAVTSWNGRIVGSDNGDVDKLATQATAADQPTSDGYVVTFADATDHLEIPSTTQAGWQVVATSLGTFAYKVDSDAITELNLLGNLGNASYRQAGDLYGIILLPENATTRDINDARQLLIDRGASDGVNPTSLDNFWRARGDIVEFGLVDTSSVTTFTNAWRVCSSLTSFPEIDTSSGTNFQSAWLGCSSLTSFPLLDTSSGTTFQGAWFNCSSLTSFPEIDTSSGTNFQSAWFGCSSLTSFPEIDTSSGTNFLQAWRDCSSLTSFPAIDASSVTSFLQAWLGCSSLTSFPLLDTSSGTTFSLAWFRCSSLTSFPLLDTSSGTTFSQAWQDCSSLVAFPKIDTSSGTSFSLAWFRCSSLTSFPANFFDSWSPAAVVSGVFNLTWINCSSLTAQSVENILTSIAASGKYATSTGLSGGTALADATIDIDYNVSTGSLTAATLTAIESLNGRGWSVNINGVIQ